MDVTVKDPNKPDYRNAISMAMETDLEIVRDLAKGTRRIRSKKKYLPQEDRESDTSYKIRVGRSLLFNTFVKTRNALVGMGFKTDPVLDTDVPPQVRADLEDVDLAGSHFDVFLKQAFTDAVNDGHVFLFVDMQPELERSLTSAAPVPDASDDQASGRRPYWVEFRKDQAYNWASDRINGERVLTRITFQECATVPDGEYGEKEVKRYRVLKLPLLRLAEKGRPALYGSMQWELHLEKTVKGKSELELIDGDTTDLPRIPVVTIYTNRTGFLESDPPLLDLAHLNIGHYQQWSDLNNQVRYLTPFTVRKFDTKEEQKADDDPKAKEEIAIGPNAVVDIYGEHAEVSLVSHNADCVKPARESLMDLESRMSAVGLSIISAKKDNETTATEKVLDQGERTSELNTWIRALSDGAEACLKLHAGYYNLSDGGSVIMAKVTEPDPEAVSAIKAPVPSPQMAPAPAAVQ